MNSAEMVVKVGLLSNRLDEATAKGFKDNPRAMNIVAELKDTVGMLEELAFREFNPMLEHVAREEDARLIALSNADIRNGDKS